MTAPRFVLRVLPGRYAVCQLPAQAAPPVWAMRGAFWSVTRTPDELSVICDTAHLPADLPTDVPVATDWVTLQVVGPFDFGVTGVMAALSGTLAGAGVSLLPVATYATDYLLLQAAQVDAAVAALSAAGHTVQTMA